MRKQILAVVGLAMALAPLALGAQTPDEQIRRSLARAADAGVPVALLQSKIDEGRAKGIPMARIAAAVANRLEVLERVHDRLAAQNLDAAELGVAADAAQAGVSDAVLESITTAAPRERRAVALAALTQLVQMGHVPEDALARVTEALQRGPDALMNLPAQAAAARSRGAPAGAAGGNGPAAGPGQGGGQGGGQGNGQGGGQGGPPPGVPAGGKGKGPPTMRPGGEV
jgi:hypothetical protein